MAACFEICQEDGLWVPYYLGFSEAKDMDRYVNGAEDFESFDQETCGRRWVNDEKARHQFRSVEQAVDVIRHALANPGHKVHSREPLDAATPIYVLDPQSGHRRRA